MTDRRTRGRDLRALWATLGVICLLGAGGAYGVARYQQSQLERDATRDDHKLSVDVFEPLLEPSDLDGPIRGDRYDELLAATREGLLAGPINGVRVWSQDGMVLFADEADLVGDRQPDLQDEIHSAISGTSESVVSGDRFRSFTSLRIGDPAVVAAVELDRSHGAIVAEAEKTWEPWRKRALAAAAVFGGLYLLTAIVFAALAILDRQATRRRTERAAEAAEARRRPSSANAANLPAYVQPGFQQEMEERRRLEEEIETLRRERDVLIERVRRLEADPNGAHRSLAERLGRPRPGPEALQPTGPRDPAGGS